MNPEHRRVVLRLDLAAVGLLLVVVVGYELVVVLPPCEDVGPVAANKKIGSLAPISSRNVIPFPKANSLIKSTLGTPDLAYYS